MTTKEHSARFKIVSGYYQKGLWNLDRVAKAVEYGWITKEEYELILNKQYV